MIKAAIMGFGTIGSGVAEVLDINKKSIAARVGDEVELKYVLDLRDFEGDPIQSKIVHDYKVIAEDPEVSIVVETMGGVEPAYTFVKTMLEAGKHVTTSNKALVAAKGAELIALANILVYIILSFGGATEDAFYMASRGAMYPEFLTINHQWWRLLTAMFLHFGVAHLMNNMVIFCCVGSRLEKYIGHWKMAVVYFAAGIGGGLLSYIMMLLSGNYAVSGGASGAVFGVIGGLLWVVIYHRGKLEGMTTKGILIMVVLSLYFGFTSTGVDNWCHVGGMLCGFLATLILYHGKRQKY